MFNQWKKKLFNNKMRYSYFQSSLTWRHFWHNNSNRFYAHKLEKFYFMEERWIFRFVQLRGSFIEGIPIVSRICLPGELRKSSKIETNSKWSGFSSKAGNGKKVRNRRKAGSISKQGGSLGRKHYFIRCRCTNQTLSWLWSAKQWS